MRASWDEDHLVKSLSAQGIIKIMKDIIESVQYIDFGVICDKVISENVGEELPIQNICWSHSYGDAELTLVRIDSVIDDIDSMDDDRFAWLWTELMQLREQNPNILIGFNG